MARREYNIRFQCAEPGCREQYWSVATTRDDERRTRRWYAERPWKCTRHTQPDEVLSADNPERVTVLVAEPNTDLGKSFWRESAQRAGSGFSYGPGYKAYANDFPPGTRLIITARIELPESDADQ